MECNLPYQEQGCIGCSESVCLEDLCECGELLNSDDCYCEEEEWDPKPSPASMGLSRDWKNK